jgi:hypothetical protein
MRPDKRNEIKRGPNEGHPQNKDQHGGKESNDRTVYVKVFPRIDSLEDFRNDYNAAQKSNTSQAKKQLAWSVISAVLLFIYAGFTYWQGHSAQKLVRIAQATFDASNRPYIGVDGFDTVHFGHRPKQDRPKESEDFTSPNPTPQTDHMLFRVVIKNFGPVPGTNFVAKWQIFADGKEIHPNVEIPDKSAVLFPTQPTMLGGFLGGADYKSLIGGSLTLRMKIYISYDGPQKHYEECETVQYDHTVNRFLNLGSGCT